MTHTEDLTKTAQQLEETWINHISSGTHLGKPHLIAEPEEFDAFKVNLLLKHLQDEFPQFRSISDWKGLLQSDADILHPIRVVAARGTFRGACEACPEVPSTNMPIADAIEEYLKFHQNSSPRTRQMYASVLNRLAEQIEEIPQRPEPLEEFLNQFSGDTTRHNCYKIIRWFFKWLSERQGVANPTDLMKAPKLKKKVVPSLSIDEFNSILEQPLSDRDRAVIMLLGGCGLRVGEAVNLTFEHINEDTLRVPEEGKTGERTVPLASNIKQALLTLKNGHKANSPIFWGSHPVAPLGVAGFEQVVKKAFKMAGIEGKRASPHTLRHSFGRIWCSQGGNVSQLQRIFGHTNLATTQKYIYLDDKDVMKGYEQYSPFASDISLPKDDISTDDDSISSPDDRQTL